ncbi:glutamate carboxypeptidase [Chamaesiphon minutus]|nr:glutamate carboxypeptidase [Chamaesiphon minutus]
MKINSIHVILISLVLTILLVLGHHDLARSATDSLIYDKAQQAQPSFLKHLEQIVNIDSQTNDAKGLMQVEKLVIDRLKSIGADIKTVTAKPNAGNIIIGTIAGTGRGKILLLAHTDTVFKQGTVAQRPFKIVNNKAFGPGVMDDKGGILLGVEALKILKETKFKDFKTITFLINSDEETGSIGSRELIKATAKKHDVALVLEFGSPQDKITSWRKGIGTYGIKVKGRAAHAGAEPEKGCNALVEAAHQTLQLSKLGDSSKQTTINFTIFQAGDRRNIIPDTANVEADVRVLEAREFDRLKNDFTRITKNKLLPCTQIEIQATPGRPPFPPNPQTDALVKKAVAIYQQIGLKLGVECSGGGTDGNYAAIVGTSTLDALGPVGGGAHSATEYIDIDRIAPRIYLLTKLIMDLASSTR